MLDRSAELIAAEVAGEVEANTADAARSAARGALSFIRPKWPYATGLSRGGLYTEVTYGGRGLRVRLRNVHDYAIHVLNRWVPELRDEFIDRFRRLFAEGG